ncbi:MAG: hypothetical protein GXP37_02985 [Chloroflexi bacterium]|nr:hypothetical protein [Chloroflexota bacterium]
MNYESFLNPNKVYREITFWAWNDELDANELRRQVASMDDAGLGGFFMHAREGLRTSYLGSKWMACVRVCVEEAKKRGLSAWLYDEDRWPSGFAGGLSVAPEPEHRMKALVCKVDNKPALISERVAAFVAREEHGRLCDMRPLERTEMPEMDSEDDRLIQFYVRTAPLGNPRFNGYTYLDLLNPDAVRYFLETTHEVYAREFADAFGDVIPGIFSDEPCIHFHPSVPWSRDLPIMSIPWSKDFDTYFQDQNGYDLIQRLPSLFFDVDSAGQEAHRSFQEVRYHFWRTVTQRFVDSFSAQVYAWCDSHNLAYTGHTMGEDTLLSQIRWIGAAMPHYESMHIPGVDNLGRALNRWAGTVLAMKQLDSVVCQLDKQRALCENYGCTGQGFTPAGHKKLGDWACVMGINLLNTHLSLYSMRSFRKRDYPPNLFYQQPWWPDNKPLADYFARLSYAMSQGQRVVDTLVIHPMGSAWISYRPHASYAVDQLDQALNDLGLILLQNQRDFHFGDEMLMAKHAEVRTETAPDGELQPLLQVGVICYRVVIVPPGISLAASTVQLLHEFAAAGGVVLALEPTPHLVEGRRGEQAPLPPETQTLTLSALPAALDRCLPFDVRIVDQPHIWVHHRRQHKTDWYFCANIDGEKGGLATVQLRGKRGVEVWDAATGGTRPLPGAYHGDVTEITLDFALADSYLLVCDEEKGAGADSRRHFATPLAFVRSDVLNETRLSKPWRLSLDCPNALMLDMTQLKIGQRAWSAPMHVLAAQKEVKTSGPGTPFALRFAFYCAEVPAHPVHLVVETPAQFRIFWNGRLLDQKEAGWWIDTSFRKIAVPDVIRPGRNEIILTGVFDDETELESITIIGDFGVRAERVREENRAEGQRFDRYAPEFQIAALPASVGLDGDVDLTAAGLPFFAGRVRLAQTVQLSAMKGKVMLDVESLQAAVAHVRVNDNRVGTMAWPPLQVDVTEALREGENQIEIEVVGTLRNLLGPHHRSGGDPDCTGPYSFSNKAKWTHDSILVPFGFTGARLLELREETL